MGDPKTQIVVSKEPGSLPIQCPILTATNYVIWTVKIKAIFRVQGLLETIEPIEGTVIDPKKDGMAIVYLYQAMPEEMMMQVAHLDTAKEIWDALKTRYVGVERVREDRLESLQYEFESLKMKDADSLDDFTSKLSQVASKASTLGKVYEEKDLVRKLMSSVPRRWYLAIVATIEQFADLKTMSFQDAVGRLKAFEERLGGKSTAESSQAGRGKGRGKTGDKDKDKKNEPSQKKDRSKIKCFGCDELGHFASACPTRKKEKNGESNLAQGEGPVLHTITEAREEVVFLKEDRVDPQKYATTPRENNTWILDNGASNHMTGNSEWFSKLNHNTIGKVNLQDEAWVWHARLGHLNFDALKSLSKLAIGLHEIKHPTQVCNSCMVGKQTRSSFPKDSLYRDKTPLELIYADVCGPIAPKTHGGNQYFLLVVDDHTRYMWVFTMKTKDEVANHLIDFVTRVENETGKKIKAIRSDNGGEFTSHMLSDFLNSKGVVHQFITPYTPQQNGVVEIRNRTILGATRSMLKAMSLPQNL
ncbi:hypothetical protein L1987_39066 [Smallanthus sonchifolius]|uniref:Uncharacterized protein n=1 Tax=Smallanthus sonchifolius TaxID=185202 RepID=A0ACB9HM57_9ASTR|nr:hypothetical protein L1987_39066 [Smallanthus sonchifolius]